MKWKTCVRAILTAVTLFLCISRKSCVRGQEAQMAGKTQDNNLTDHNNAYKAADDTIIIEVGEQGATTSITKGTLSDATAKLRRSSLPAFPYIATVDTKHDGSNQCEKARLCSLNNDHRPDRCSCHSHCHLFGDCCEDASQWNDSKISGILPRTAYSCYAFNSPVAKAVNVLTSCPEYYQVESVVKACNRSLLLLEHETSLDSLFTPITEGSTGLTYGNVFCAICWDANPHTSEPWLWNFQCNSDNFGKGNNKTIAASFFWSRHFSTSVKNVSSTLTYLRKMCKFSFLPPRKLSAPLTECDPTEISTCPSSLDPTDDLAILCHRTPVRRVYYNKMAYRNVHCLACNYNGDQDLSWSCLAPRASSSPEWSFEILIPQSTEYSDVNERYLQLTVNENVLCNALTDCITRDMLANECTRVCPCTMVYHESESHARNAKSLCSFLKAFDESFIPCSYWLLLSNETLLVQLNATVTVFCPCVFELFENYKPVNGSFVVTVNGTNILYNNISYVKNGIVSLGKSAEGEFVPISVEDDGTGCVSLPWWLPLTLIVISQGCLIVYFSLYAAVERLRRFQGEMVLHQAIAIFWGYTFFVLRWIPANSLIVCRTLVILLHYFFIASFSWTSLFAIEVTRALSGVVSVARPCRVNRRRFAYYLVGWGVPLLPVLLGVAADELALEIAPAYGTWQCFFGGRLGYSVLFAAPMCVCLTIDVVVYLYVIVRLAMVERQTRMARDTRREKVLLSIKLLIALGLPWAVTVAASFSDLNELKCAFKLVNSLQGVIILFIFGIKRDVIASLKCCLPLSKHQITSRSSSNIAPTMDTPETSSQAPESRHSGQLSRI